MTKKLLALCMLYSTPIAVSHTISLQSVPHRQVKRTERVTERHPEQEPNGEISRPEVEEFLEEDFSKGKISQSIYEACNQALQMQPTFQKVLRSLQKNIAESLWYGHRRDFAAPIAIVVVAAITLSFCDNGNEGMNFWAGAYLWWYNLLSRAMNLTRGNHPLLPMVVKPLTPSIVFSVAFIAVDLALFCCVRLSENPTRRNQRILYQYLYKAQLITTPQHTTLFL